MATKFLEPGGDATFNVATTTAGGFWGIKANSPDVATDIVHGSHIKSISIQSNEAVFTPNGVLADAGSRYSFYFYIVAMPTSTKELAGIWTASAGAKRAGLMLTSAGVLQLFGNASQIGTDGSTLSTGQWYRLSVAFVLTALNDNEFRVFVDGVLDISVTDGAVDTSASVLGFNRNVTDATYDVRFSDIYVDNSASLTDTGDIWVTAKRPNANGTLNEWTTQIGAGGSGYGTGHSPQVNERALDTANGWSFQDAALKTEEYTIESVSTGDIDITGATIIDYMGWVYAKVASNSTGNIIVAGTATNKSITTAYGMFTQAAGSTTYPSGGDAIGMNTNTVNQLFSLAECGIMIAYTPAVIQEWYAVIS